MTDLLKRYRLTQAQASKLLGIPVRTIQNWCEGKREPPDYILMLISFYLQKTIGEC